MASQKAPVMTGHVGHSLAARLRSASEERNVDELMSYYAQDATFLDVGESFLIVPEAFLLSIQFDIDTMAVGVVNDQLLSGWNAIRDFYTIAYQQMPVFKIQPQKVTVADNCLIVELKCEGTMAEATSRSSEDEQMSSATPVTIHMVGVTLLWWRWEGDLNEEDGNGGSSDSSLLGWKIIEERAYVMRS